MSKNKCGLIKDILPLYADEVCSEESRKAVAEHISECPECRRELEKMGRSIAIGADNDIKVIKRIRRRICIERITIISVCVFIILAVVFAVTVFMNTCCAMDYEKYALADNIRIEAEENGDIWLVKKGYAAESAYAYPTLRDENGHYMGYNDSEFDKNAVAAYGFTLNHRRILGMGKFEISSSEEKTFLFNSNEKENIKEIFYYDAENNKEYILWERY